MTENAANTAEKECKFKVEIEDESILVSSRRQRVKDIIMANDQELEFYEHAAFPDNKHLGDLGNLLEEQDYQLNDEDHNSDENLVLIADDCSFNIVAVQSLLLQFNLKSDVCVNGHEAVKLVKNRLKADPQKPMYKLVLMDFSMPKCDGPEATKQIRQYLLKKNSQKQPLICCLTAYTDKPFKDIAKEAGIDCFLSKPVFKTTIHKLLIKALLIK